MSVRAVKKITVISVSCPFSLVVKSYKQLNVFLAPPQMRGAWEVVEGGRGFGSASEDVLYLGCQVTVSARLSE